MKVIFIKTAAEAGSKKKCHRALLAKFSVSSFSLSILLIILKKTFLLDSKVSRSFFLTFFHKLIHCTSGVMEFQVSYSVTFINIILNIIL